MAFFSFLSSSSIAATCRNRSSLPPCPASPSAWSVEARDGAVEEAREGGDAEEVRRRMKGVSICSTRANSRGRGGRGLEEEGGELEHGKRRMRVRECTRGWAFEAEQRPPSLSCPDRERTYIYKLMLHGCVCVYIRQGVDDGMREEIGNGEGRGREGGRRGRCVRFVATHSEAVAPDLSMPSVHSVVEGPQD